MPSSRLFHAVMLMFWVGFLVLMALVFVYVPRGGTSLGGLVLFAHSGLTGSTSLAMMTMGIDQASQIAFYGFLAAANLAAAGLLLFAMLFFVFGELDEQHEARPMAEGAAAISAIAAFLVVCVSLAGGQAGSLLFLSLVVSSGLMLSVRTLVPMVRQPEPDAIEAAELDELVNRHAASHAAFSARLASISRKGPTS